MNYSKFVKDVKDILIFISPVFIMGFFGYLLTFIFKASAQAAVNVRPKLAEVDYLSAFLTGHSTDWLFYHKPFWMTVVVVFIFLIIGIIINIALFYLLGEVDEE